MRLFLLSLFFTLPISLFTQQMALERYLFSTDGVHLRLDTTASGTSLYQLALDYDEIAGSPYLQEEKLKGVLFMRTGEVFSNISFRYNVYQDAVEVEVNELRILIKPTALIRFSFRDPLTHKKRIFENGLVVGRQTGKRRISRFSYLEVLYEGEHVLAYGRWTKALEPTTFTNVKGEHLLTYRFLPTTLELFLFGNGIFSPVELTESGMLAVLSDKADQIKAYIDRFDLKCQSLEDFVQIVRYYDSLLYE